MFISNYNFFNTNDLLCFLCKKFYFWNNISSVIYNYGILRCTDTDFSALDTADILAYHKRDYQIDVLTADMKNAAKKYKNIVIDHASIDEIMLILVKGNII